MAGTGAPVDVAAEAERLEALRIQLEQREAHIMAERRRIENQRRELEEERRRWTMDEESVHENSDGEDAAGNPNRSLMDYCAPRVKDIAGPVVIQGIEANNMQILPAHVTAVQQNSFHGDEHEDPHAHLQTFTDYVRLIKMNGVPQNAIRLMLFRFSLKDKAQK
ncbi:hypothetical protein LUZ61_017269 [Rhynchospora tenuis]|uniref:Reverse transcriptase domain-containing protein n=1 Tax=Rhynchospora tenuis TaxID=198213 RepID=A0AAD5Z747_9POAL|nr:hypothetical protein LUZ61_017269 [Rhynchospora tenuis]